MFPDLTHYFSLKYVISRILDTWISLRYWKIMRENTQPALNYNFQAFVWSLSLLLSFQDKSSVDWFDWWNFIFQDEDLISSGDLVFFTAIWMSNSVLQFFLLVKTVRFSINLDGAGFSKIWYSGLLKVSTFLAGTDGYFSVSNCLQPFQKFLAVDLLTKFSLSLFFLCGSFGKMVDYDPFSQDSWTKEKFSSEIFLISSKVVQCIFHAWNQQINE